MWPSQNASCSRPSVTESYISPRDTSEWGQLIDVLSARIGNLPKELWDETGTASQSYGEYRGRALAWSGDSSLLLIKSLINAVQPPNRTMAPRVFSNTDLESSKDITSKMYRIPTMAMPRMAKKPVMVMILFIIRPTDSAMRLAFNLSVLFHLTNGIAPTLKIAL